MIKSNDRLKNQLEIQSRLIEAVFNQYGLPIRVKHSSIANRRANFELSTSSIVGEGTLREILRQLRHTLNLPVTLIHWDTKGIQLSVHQKEGTPVDLLDMLASLPNLPPATAVLGLGAEHRPVLLNLGAGSVTNILLAGMPNSGKSALIRGLLLSLAIRNRQSQVQMVAIDYRPLDGEEDPRPKFLFPLGLIPHMLHPVLSNLEDIARTLAFLVEEVSYRKQRQVSQPITVITINHLNYLLTNGGSPITEPLAFLLQNGQHVGIHFLICSDDPTAPAVQSLIKGNVSVRLIGRLPNAWAARAATCITESGAEYLLGKGDFLALSAGGLVPFQAAIIGDYDLHLTLERLNRQKQPSIVASPTDPRTHLNPRNPDHQSNKLRIGLTF